MELVADALAGDRSALARLLSLVEDGGFGARPALAALHSHSGGAHIVGLTGASGVGKSTLVNELVKLLRDRDVAVGVVAVDPSSSFTGGALLGDRVRMRDVAGDNDTFIRSMASRGSHGGLARATNDVVKVLDAVGFGVVLLETVGAGQAEVDIARVAHTIVVVESPGMGDEVQALKAGLMEIADVLVVNKADRPGVAQTVRGLRMAVDGGSPGSGDGERRWYPPILQTVALDGTGVLEVLEAVTAHREHLLGSGLWAERARTRAETQLLDVLAEELLSRVRARVGEDRMQEWVDLIAEHKIDAYSATRSILAG